MKKGNLRWMMCALATVCGCSDASGPSPAPDAAPPPDSATWPGTPDAPSLGLWSDPGFTMGQGEWTFVGAEMAPEARWSADQGVVHMLQPGHRVSRMVELPANDDMVAIRIVWRGNGRSVLRAGVREDEMIGANVWTYATMCVGRLSAPMRIEVALEQTTEGLVELDHLDVVTTRGCWNPYP